MTTFKQYLIEIANTILKSDDLIDVFYPTEDNLYKTSIFFKFKNLIYCVGLQKLDISETPMGKKLKTKLLSYSILGVEFGNVDTVGAQLNTKQFKVGHASAIKILSIISNLIQNFCELNSIDIVIFSAKNEDGMFSRRSALYSSLASTFCKRYGYSYKSYQRDEGMDFIIFRNNSYLTKKEEFQLKKLIQLKLSIIDKLFSKILK